MLSPVETENATLGEGGRLLLLGELVGSLASVGHGRLRSNNFGGFPAVRRFISYLLFIIQMVGAQLCSWSFRYFFGATIIIESYYNCHPDQKRGISDLGPQHRLGPEPVTPNFEIGKIGLYLFELFSRARRRSC